MSVHYWSAQVGPVTGCYGHLCLGLAQQVPVLAAVILLKTSVSWLHLAWTCQQQIFQSTFKLSPQETQGMVLIIKGQHMYSGISPLNSQ